MFENGVSTCLEPLNLGSALHLLAELTAAGFKPNESGLNWTAENWQEPASLIGLDNERLAERPKTVRRIFGIDRLVVVEKYLDHETTVTHRLHTLYNKVLKKTESEDRAAEAVLSYIIEFATDNVWLEINDLAVCFSKPIKHDPLLADSIAVKADKIEAEEDEAFLDAPSFRPSENPTQVQHRFAKGIKPSKGKHRKPSDKVAPEWTIRPNEYKLGDIKSCRKACADRRTVVIEGTKPIGTVWAEWYRFDEESGMGWREEARRDPQTGLMRMYAHKFPVVIGTFHLFPELESLSAMADTLLK